MPDNNDKPQEETMARVTIELDQQGRINLNTNIQDSVIVCGMLEVARHLYLSQRFQPKIVAPAGAIPAHFGRPRG